MCGWLLRGRTHLTSQKFQDEGHLQLFNNIYHIIHMLAPDVFSMVKTLQSYVLALYIAYFK